MNLTETKRQLSIAHDQANISEKKMNWYKQNNLPKTAEVYAVRMHALRLFAKELKANIRKHEGKTFKRVNND